MARRSDKVNTEALDVMDGVIERIDFQLTSVAGAGIDLSDGEGSAENIVDPGSEAVANPLLTGAVRYRIAGKNKVTAVPGRHFKFLRDSHSPIHRNFRALPAENASAIIDRDLLLRPFVVHSDCSGGTDFRSRPRIVPLRKVESRPAAKVLRDPRRFLRV